MLVACIIACVAVTVSMHQVNIPILVKERKNRLYIYTYIDSTATQHDCGNTSYAAHQLSSRLDSLCIHDEDCMRLCMAGRTAIARDKHHTDCILKEEVRADLACMRSDGRCFCQVMHAHAHAHAHHMHCTQYYHSCR
jgi:hypothetical protein